jgi:homospermidine synthase
VDGHRHDFGRDAANSGDIVGEYCDGTPLLRRGRLFPEATDDACPRQFGNFRVV